MSRLKSYIDEAKERVTQEQLERLKPGDKIRGYMKKRRGKPKTETREIEAKVGGKEFIFTDSNHSMEVYADPIQAYNMTFVVTEILK